MTTNYYRRGRTGDKLKVKLVAVLERHDMKTHGGANVNLLVFLTSAPEDVCGQLHDPAALPPGGWMGVRLPGRGGE
jgi:hypothetical protein